MWKNDFVATKYERRAVLVGAAIKRRRSEHSLDVFVCLLLSRDAFEVDGKQVVVVDRVHGVGDVGWRERTDGEARNHVGDDVLGSGNIMDGIVKLFQK